jgi:hypothetical protein
MTHKHSGEGGRRLLIQHTALAADCRHRSLSGFGGRGENSAARGQIFGDLRTHDGSMGQKSADRWTSQTDSQNG